MRSNIITGRSGFVGENLEKYLRRKNKKVLGVSRKPSIDGLTYEDLTEKVLDASGAFIHLAGVAHDLKNAHSKSIYFEINTELTKKLFDQFLVSKCEIFIYFSSTKAVADSVEGFLDENVEPRPTTAYGQSKLAAEQYILSKEIPKGKRVFLLRPCMIHGPGNKGNLNFLYKFILKGFPYILGKYINRRSFLSVKNLCFIVLEIIENYEIESGIYNVADDTALSTNEIVNLIHEVLGTSNRSIKVPRTLIKILAKIGDCIPIPLNSEKLQKLTESYVVSNSKIRNALQKELPLSSEQGIRETIHSFIENRI